MTVIAVVMIAAVDVIVLLLSAFVRSIVVAKQDER